jgi:hypothetical protein
LLLYLDSVILLLERESGRDLMKRLNIFVDETGEFGFDDGSSRLYGVSFTFHEQMMI